MQVGAAPREDSTNPKERNRYWVASPVSHSTTCIGERRKVTKKKPTNFFHLLFSVRIYTYVQKKEDEKIGRLLLYIRTCNCMINHASFGFFFCVYVHVRTYRKKKPKENIFSVHTW